MVNAVDGVKVIKCRFCGEEVLYVFMTKRVYNEDGSFHVSTCEKRAAFFRARHEDRRESQRQLRS